MGMKSTIDLTRDAAEQKYVELRLEITKRRLRAEAAAMGDLDLEHALERLNDMAHGGEGFQNYSITE